MSAVGTPAAMNSATGSPLTSGLRWRATHPLNPLPSAIDASSSRSACRPVANLQRKSSSARRTNSAHDENGTSVVSFALTNVIISARLMLRPIDCAISYSACVLAVGRRDLRECVGAQSRPTV